MSRGRSGHDWVQSRIGRHNVGVGLAHVGTSWNLLGCELVVPAHWIQEPMMGFDSLFVQLSAWSVRHIKSWQYILLCGPSPVAALVRGPVAARGMQGTGRGTSGSHRKVSLLSNTLVWGAVAAGGNQGGELRWGGGWVRLHHDHAGGGRRSGGL